ncbi:MAG: transglycosylase domain-containing protein [Actinomycetota bacterium]
MSRTPFKKPLLLFASLALVATSCARLMELADVPKLKGSDLSRIKDLAQSSKIYDRDRNLITTFHGEQNRTIIPLERIPLRVQQSVIAIEDERFYEHGGVDWRAVGRAFVANVSSGEIREGGSTITQQYVKNTIIAPRGGAERTLERKLIEAGLARQLEKELTKKQILERYLNTVYFGQGAYGIQAAAKTFFGVPAADLKLHQSALLAATIRAPEFYDPFDHPEAARERRNVVLDKMLELGMIDEAEHIRATSSRLRLQTVEQKDRYDAPYFIDYVQRLISYDPRFDVLGKTLAERTDKLFKGGLRIYTTVDLDMQREAEQAVHTHLSEDSDPHASLVSLEPDTGNIRAMVGGRDFFAPRREDPFAKLNLATLAEPNLGCVRNEKAACREPLKPAPAPGTGRQAGSAFKPFALAAAIEKGVPLSKTYKASPCMDFPGANAGANWHVCNYESSDFGAKLPLLEATVKSVNVVYAQLILEIGEAAVVELAEDMGIRTDLDVVPSAALGTNVVNPLDMASAYGAFATNGTLHPPRAVEKIVDSNGKVLYDANKDLALAPQEVLDPPVAYLTTSALQQVVERGTATRANIGRPVAGKTGTSQEYRDAWFVGYTPDLVTSVWVGYPEGEIEMKSSCYSSLCRPTRVLSGTGVTGGSWPAAIWQSFMSAALAGIPVSYFDVPGFGIVTVTVDTRNFCLADEFTPDEFRATASFPEGSEPEESCRVKGDLVEIPDVFGFPVRDAVRILEGEGFKVLQKEEPTTTYPPGRVIGQDPGAGKKVPRGSTVAILVSVHGEPQDETDDEDDDTATVPNVLGYTRSAAEAALRNEGFNVRVIVESESDPQEARKRKGRVWKQDPAGGTQAEEGSTVTIWVNPD